MSSSGESGSYGERTRWRGGRRRRTYYTLAVTAAAATALATACSSSSSSSSVTGAAASTHKSLTTLTIDAAFFGPVDVPLYYAEAKGYFAKQGLDVKFVVASSNTQLASVLGGSVQFASTDPLNTISAEANGAQFVNFMAVEIGYSEDVIMSKSAYQAAGLNANSTVKQKIQAMAGKKLGVISATGENATIFKYLFKYAGVPTSKLDMVQLGTPAAILAAMKEGTVVAANVGSPYPAEAVADGYAEYLLRAPLGDVPPMGTALTQTLAATSAYYKSNQSTIKKFIAGYEEGLNAMLANPTSVATYVAKKYFATQSLSAFMSSFNEDLPIIPKSPDITTAQTSALKTVAAGAGFSIPSNWASFFAAP